MIARLLDSGLPLVLGILVVVLLAQRACEVAP